MDKKIIKDLYIISFSIIVAIVLVKTNAIENLINSTKEYEILASFIAGLFYTSIFTVAPATVAIIEIAHKSNPILIALAGGFGALLGDYIIFKYIKDNVSGYIASIAHKIRRESILESKIFRLSFALVGAVIIGSPLPDEIGLALMGVTKMRTLYFVPISYVLNSIGIFVLAFIGKFV